MTRNDFIANYTEDYTELLTDTHKQAKRCEYINEGLTEWYIDGKYVNINDMTADQLVKVFVEIQAMADDLAELADLVSAMATAKNELESVDLYEFDDDETAPYQNKEDLTVRKTKYMYRNTTFFYVAFDGCIMWYTADDKYLGTTDNSVRSANSFLDTQIV